MHFKKKIDPSADLHTRAAAALRIAGPDAVLVSHTAVRLYGCTDASTSPIHVVVPSDQRVRPRAGLVVRRADLERRQVETVHNLKVLSLDHALADMLCNAHSPTAFRCLTQAIAMHPDGFRDLVTRCVLSRPVSSSRRRAEILLHLASGSPMRQLQPA